MPTISHFKANFSGGGARSNHFKIFLNFPVLVVGSLNAARKSEFLCSATSLPGSRITTGNVSYRARSYELPVGRIVEPWTITMLNDTDFDMHDAMEKWLNLVNNIKTNQGAINPLVYTSTLEVFQLNQSGGVLKKYKMQNAWPISMSRIDLAWDTASRIETFDVTFNYDWWEAEKGLGVSTTVKGFTLGT